MRFLFRGVFLPPVFHPLFRRNGSSTLLPRFAGGTSPFSINNLKQKKIRAFRFSQSKKMNTPEK
jgi:hypothetical protein